MRGILLTLLWWEKEPGKGSASGRGDMFLMYTVIIVSGA